MQHDEQQIRELVATWMAATRSGDVDTVSGVIDKVKVGAEPHGLTVWPQPGRYSLGHTGNLR